MEAIKSNGLTQSALVSFWRSENQVATEYFACSGVFIGEGLILTVAHVFQNSRLWVRPYSDATQSYSIIGQPEFHPSLDAALVMIEFMPQSSAIAPLDISGKIGDANKTMTLNGYFAGRCELAQPIKWLSFESKDRVHLLNVKQPKGHSGSGIESRGRLWGMTISHFEDPNIHRGCAISIGQLWIGWLDRLLVSSDITNDFAFVTPRYDVESRAKDIRFYVASSELNIAKKHLMDLVDDFSTEEDINEAVVLSMKLEDLCKRNPNLISSIKEKEVIARRMLLLMNRVLTRLRRMIDDKQ